MAEEINNHLLSIIIPYYNTGQYTDELLSKLNEQITDEVQVILVDDGSKTPYISEYEWLTIIYQKNGGVSSARNNGLDNSDGGYVIFLDSDDLVADNYCSSILNKIKTEEFDYCYLSWESFGSWQVSIKLNSIDDEFPDYNLCCWNRVYKRDKIADIRFNEDKAIAEDAQFIRDVQDNCKKKAYISDIMYYYRSDTPNSLTKRYSNGEIAMERTVYNITHITSDMTYLIDEIKELNEHGEVIVMTNQCDIPELKRYAMVTKPINIKGTELRGEPTSLFYKLDIPYKCDIAIWAGDIFAIGGMETFLYYYCDAMHKKYSIAVIYKALDFKQAERLKGLCKLIHIDERKVECSLLVANRALDPAPISIVYRQKVQMIHCCKINDMWHVQTDNDFIIPVSNTVKDTYLEDIGNHPTKIINNIVKKPEPKKVLKLISATRLTYEKGSERMVQFAKLLKKNDIPFVWLIFSQDRLKEDIDGVVYMQPNINVIDYINQADYLVQLSDSEAFCYSIAEALSMGVPCITTPLPVLKELGFRDKVDGFVLPVINQTDKVLNSENILDITRIDVNEIYGADLTIDYCYNNDDVIEQWEKIVDKAKTKKLMRCKKGYAIVQCIKVYKSIPLNRMVQLGETIEVSVDRAKVLQNFNVVKIIEICEETDMNTIMVSLDTSTRKTGVGIFKNGEYIEHRLLDFSKNKNTDERIDQMCSAIVEVLDEFKPQIIGIEDDWSKQNVQTTKMLSEIIGVVKGYALQHKCQFEKFLPSQWRGLLGMSQGGKKREELKQMSIDYIKKELGLDVTDDEADAIALGMAIVEYYNQFDGE